MCNVAEQTLLYFVLVYSSVRFFCEATAVCHFLSGFCSVSLVVLILFSSDWLASFNTRLF